MKAVIIYEPSGMPRDAIMAVFPRHKVLIDEFAGRGESPHILWRSLRFRQQRRAFAFDERGIELCCDQ